MEHLSVKCYGYLQLTESQEEDLQQFLQKRGLHTFDRSTKDARSPIYGIVKELLPQSTPFEPRMIPRMINDIHDYHRYGVYVGDIRASNYRDGILFDLSRAKTVPHPELTPEFVDQCFGEGFHEKPQVDDQEMDIMIDDWNIMHRKEGRYIWQRMGPNQDRRARLRTYKKMGGMSHRYLHPKFRPECFDWKSLKPVTKRTMKLMKPERNDHWTGDHFHKGHILTREEANRLADERDRIRLQHYREKQAKKRAEKKDKIL